MWVITINEGSAPRYLARPALPFHAGRGVSATAKPIIDKIRNKPFPLTLSLSLVLKRHASILCDYARMRFVPAYRPRRIPWAAFIVEDGNRHFSLNSRWTGYLDTALHFIVFFLWTPLVWYVRTRRQTLVGVDEIGDGRARSATRMRGRNVAGAGWMYVCFVLAGRQGRTENRVCG